MAVEKPQTSIVVGLSGREDRELRTKYLPASLEGIVAGATSLEDLRSLLVACWTHFGDSEELATRKVNDYLEGKEFDDAIAGLREQLSHLKAEEAPAGIEPFRVEVFRALASSGTNAGETSRAEERRLSAEDAERTLGAIEARFSANIHLHEGLDWNRVKAVLKANSEALWSVNKLEEAGHKPDVYNFDKQGFDIGTCSTESPESARNCVYDAEAVVLLRDDSPNEIYNGSAVEMAEAMGISLMSPEQYEMIQAKGKFDLQAWSWLLTDQAIRKSGFALSGDRDGAMVYVRQNVAHDLNDYRAWRGSLRVSWP